jgi:hypothetical protein
VVEVVQALKAPQALKATQALKAPQVPQDISADLSLHRLYQMQIVYMI